jgi:hypothetical protein
VLYPTDKAVNNKLFSNLSQREPVTVGFLCRPVGRRVIADTRECTDMMESRGIPSSGKMLALLGAASLVALLVALAGNDHGGPAPPRNIHHNDKEEEQVPRVGGSAAASQGVLRQLRALSNRESRSAFIGGAGVPKVLAAASRVGFGAGLARAVSEQIFQGSREEEAGSAAGLRARPVASLTMIAEDWELLEEGGNATNSSDSGAGGGGGCPTRRGLRGLRRNGTDGGNGTAGGNGTRSSFVSCIESWY